MNATSARASIQAATKKAPNAARHDCVNWAAASRDYALLMMKARAALAFPRASSSGPPVRRAHSLTKNKRPTRDFCESMTGAGTHARVAAGLPPGTSLAGVDPTTNWWARPVFAWGVTRASAQAAPIRGQLLLARRSL